MNAVATEYTIDEIRPGARTAVNTCMGVQPGERVLILGDIASHLINQAIAEAAEAAGATVELHELESLASRPILSVPEELQARVESFQPDVSFYTASNQPGEMQFRDEYRPLVMAANPRGGRHAHMVNVTPELMIQGMQVDYQRVHQVTTRVTELARATSEIRVTNPKGTDLLATFSPERSWISCHGLYRSPGQWGNLPEGETFTAPVSVDGILVADELGDYFGEKYGVLETPVTFEMEDGYVRSVHCLDGNIQEDVEKYIFGADAGNRVGEFAIGTNVGLAHLVGNLLQDEKLPGVHLALGDPLGAQTGADWSSVVHLVAISTFCTIEMDGRRIMTSGAFSDEILSGEALVLP